MGSEPKVSSLTDLVSYQDGSVVSKTLINKETGTVTLFAFDQEGNRVGSGGGYYDRAFQFLKKANKRKKPFLCGLAYDFQQVSNIPSEELDVSLDAVVTESRVIYCS